MKKIIAIVAVVCAIVMAIPFSGALANVGNFDIQWFRAVGCAVADEDDTFLTVNVRTASFRESLNYQGSFRDDVKIEVFAQVSEFFGLTDQDLKLRDRYLKPMGKFDGNARQMITIEIEDIDRDRYFYEVEILLVANGRVYYFNDADNSLTPVEEFDRQQYRSPSISMKLMEHYFFGSKDGKVTFLGRFTWRAARQLYGDQVYRTIEEARAHCSP